VSEDPLGLDGGLNLYAYVGSRPVNTIDPLGLVSLAVNRDPSIHFVKKNQVPNKGCAATKANFNFDGHCVCENGDWRAKLSISYSADIYIATDVIVIDPGLLGGFSSQEILLAHELSHNDSNLRLVDQARVDGERLEWRHFYSQDACENEKDRWKETWFATVKKKSDDTTAGNLWRAVRCWP
jgi:hypothetical protein